MNARQDLFALGRAPCGPAKARIRFASLWLGVCCLLTFCMARADFPNKQIITPSGPITRIVVGEDGSLQIEHQDCPLSGQFYPNGVWPADCGFFLRHNGTVHGMDYTHHGGTMASATYAAAFHPVSQTQSTDGRLVSTVMDNSTDGTGVPFKVSQYVSYWPGDAWLFVRVVVKNESATDQTVDLFAAADIYLTNSDSGYPYLSTECPQTAIGGSGDTNRAFNLFAQAAPGSLQPTAYQEDFFNEIWRVIGSGGHFQNATTPSYLDNGAGLEWQGMTIPAGGSLAIAYYWALGPVTCVELTERAQPIHVLWSGGTNMILHWDQPGYLVQASTNSLCNWHELAVPITDTEMTVGIDRQQKVFYRLARP